jgi:hypothetical protein
MYARFIGADQQDRKEIIKEAHTKNIRLIKVFFHLKTLSHFHSNRMLFGA